MNRKDLDVIASGLYRRKAGTAFVCTVADICREASANFNPEKFIASALPVSKRHEAWTLYNEMTGRKPL